MTATVPHPANCQILVNEKLAQTPSPDLFQAQHWPCATPSEEGRGASWFIDTPAGKAVLKHYRRGGLVARINREHYLFTRWSNVRALAEWHLLHELRQHGLPVPEPLAALGQRHGVVYRCAIITAWIDHQHSLTQLLRQQNENLTELWPRVGQLIAKLAEHRVDHVDFNPDNVLIDQDGRLFVIDFDRAGRRRHDGSRQIARLVRGISKRLRLEKNDDWLQHVEQGLRKGAG
jgi:3-deoxy-D-manno-octulosonic acid kinase